MDNKCSRRWWHRLRPATRADINEIKEQLDKIIMTLDDIIADAQEESTLDDSIIALLTSISAQLAAAGQDQAKLTALKSLIDANKAKIAAAVAANTPAAPPAA